LLLSSLSELAGRLLCIICRPNSLGSEQKYRMGDLQVQFVLRTTVYCTAYINAMNFRLRSVCTVVRVTLFRTSKSLKIKKERS
jgi:hypothetical protein